MRVGGLFTGIGAHHEVVKSIPGLEVCFQAEIDQRTSDAYDMMHGATPNLGDVTKIENLDANPVELLFVSPPCTSISKQGKRAGLGPGTASGLIYEIPRIIGATNSENRPRIIIWEDVPDLVNKVYLPEWENIEREMARIGYRTKWKILNAYDYGIPQSRKRFYAISRNDLEPIEFPQSEPLMCTVRQYLETDVSDEFYLSNKRFTGIIEQSSKQISDGNGFRFRPTDADGSAKTITTKEGCVKTSNYLIEKRCRVLGHLDEKGWDSIKRIYDPDGISPTIVGQYTTHVKMIMDGCRVRRLTPRECLRLQGFSDATIDRISELPRTVLYKMAGNSICVAPLRRITECAINPSHDQTTIDYWM